MKIKNDLLVKNIKVVSLLSGMPSLLPLVELSFLRFCDDGGDNRRLVSKLNSLRCDEQPENSRPKVTIVLHLLLRKIGRATWVTYEVFDSLYRIKRNPFLKYGALDNSGVIYNAFNPVMVMDRRHRLGKNETVTLGATGEATRRTEVGWRLFFAYSSLA
jgi:hypothetical protein